MPKQRHNYFMMSVFEFTTVRTEHGSRDWQVPVNLRYLSPHISRWTLVLSRRKDRQMKCPSSHQQSIHSPPSPQGRIYSVIIQTRRKERGNQLCLHQVSSWGVIRRSKLGNTAQAAQAGTRMQMSAAGNSVIRGPGGKLVWCFTLEEGDITHTLSVHRCIEQAGERGRENMKASVCTSNQSHFSLQTHSY